MTHIKEYTFYSDKIKKDQTYLLVSDFQLSENLGKEHLMEIKNSEVVKKQKLDYILIPGDIVNDSDELEQLEFRQFVLETLEEFTDGIPTIVSKGNHDQMTKKGKNWDWGNSKNIEYLLKELENVTLLNNQKTRLLPSNIRVGAFSPNFIYYGKYKESKDQFAHQFFANFNEDKFASETYNILLTHEPQSIIKLSKERNRCVQPHVDLSVSGHMHDGMTPEILKPLMKNRGLVSPQMTLFPKYSHGCVKVGDTNFVINGAVNSRIESKLINDFYGASATMINLKKGYEKIKK